MRSRQLLAAVALGTSIAFLSGCSSAKYRLTPKEDTVILVPEAASASVKGHFDNSEVAWYWQPSQYWGENPNSYVSDVLGRTVNNKPVTNVRARLDKNSWVAGAKSTIGWWSGLFVGWNMGTSMGGSGVQQATQKFAQGDIGGGLSSGGGGILFGIITFFVAWGLTQWAFDFLIPDLYGIGVEGDYVEPPTNLGKGGSSAAAAPAK